MWRPSCWRGKWPHYKVDTRCRNVAGSWLSRISTRDFLEKGQFWCQLPVTRPTVFWIPDFWTGDVPSRCVPQGIIPKEGRKEWKRKRTRSLLAVSGYYSCRCGTKLQLHKHHCCIRWKVDQWGSLHDFNSHDPRTRAQTFQSAHCSCFCVSEAQRNIPKHWLAHKGDPTAWDPNAPAACVLFHIARDIYQVCEGWSVLMGCACAYRQGGAKLVWGEPGQKPVLLCSSICSGDSPTEGQGSV